MKKQQTQQELDAITSLQELCADMERETATFERDMDGVYRDMHTKLAIIEAEVVRTQKEFAVFEKGILQEMNHLVAGYLPQKTV